MQNTLMKSGCLKKSEFFFLASPDFWKNVFTFNLHVSSHAVKPLSSSTRNYDVTTNKEFEVENWLGVSYTTRVPGTVELILGINHY